MLRRVDDPKRMTTLPPYGVPHDGIEDSSRRPSVNRLADAILREEPVMALLGVDESVVQATIDECLTLLPDQSLRIIRVRGTPGSPVTLSRIVRELGTGEPGREHAGERAEAPMDDDELIVRMLAQPSGKGGVVLVVEQAERLSRRTLAFLQVISTVFGARTPGLQVLFAGRPDFEQLLQTDELAGLRDRLGTIIHVASAASGVAPNRSASRRPDRSRVNGKVRLALFSAHWRKALASLLVLTIIAAGAVLATVWQSPTRPASGGTDAAPSSPAQGDFPSAEPVQPSPQPPNTRPSTALPPRAGLSDPSLPSSPQPGAANPDPATTASPDGRRSLPNGERLTQLRDEFNQFLAQTELGSKRQTESERSRLFDEFLQWNYGASTSNARPSPQVAAPPTLSRARVTFYFPTGSLNGEGMARRFSTTLRPSVASARTRAAADVPKTFELRYFVPEDETAAEALVQILQTPDITWLVRIIPDAKPARAPHTIEVWIPLR